MILNDLYKALKEIGTQSYFILNEKDSISTNIIEYNRKKGYWEYYFIDERGGKCNYFTFKTEDEACKFILDEAIKTIRIFRDAHLEAIRRKYMSL